MIRTATKLLVAVNLLVSTPAAQAWGYKGHEVIALIARSYLSAGVEAKLDALLATDNDTLTSKDMASRATWADAWRAAGHRETAQWHFADIELDHPDLSEACFSFPRLAGPASAGPAEDCVVDKVDEFTAELGDPATSPAERLLALKYLLHFVGDLHQPLHASDNHDKGGNCVVVALGSSRTVNLHAYWDSAVVDALGDKPEGIATTLRSRITAADKQQWEQGDPRAWALEAFQVARTVTYTLESKPGCVPNSAPLNLPPGYEKEKKKLVKSI